MGREWATNTLPNKSPRMRAGRKAWPRNLGSHRSGHVQMAVRSPRKPVLWQPILTIDPTTTAIAPGLLQRTPYFGDFFEEQCGWGRIDSILVLQRHADCRQCAFWARK